MVYVKYTREMLSEAVAASTSMAAVLRLLGLQQTGGGHAHMRRRIEKFGIDTTHFVGKAHFRGIPSSRRRPPAEILVVRPANAKREAPAILRRALNEMGRPYLCAACGVGDSWHGQPLTLHVDHIDGQFWDCRPQNLRFLCPNCHSQTATYAGRNRQHTSMTMIRVDAQGNTVSADAPTAPLSEQEKVEVLARIGRKEMTVTDAARLIGCNRHHVYDLQRRLAERGSLAPQRRGRVRLTAADREAVISFALDHPLMGPRTLTSELRARHISISDTSVYSILNSAGLSTARARMAAAGARQPPRSV